MGFQKIAFFFGLMVFAIGMMSCQKENCLSGDGYTQKTVRSVANFRKISADLSATVELIKDTNDLVPYIEIIAESNVDEHIVSSVVNQELRLSLGFCFTAHKDIIIKVHYDTLAQITVNGPADFTSGNLMQQAALQLINQGQGSIDVNVHAQEVDAVIRGTGPIILSGQITTQHTEIMGSGKLEGYNCFVVDHNIETTGSGYAYTRVFRHLNAIIRGTGNIYYKGFPIIDDTITGSGEIINDN